VDAFEESVARLCEALLALPAGHRGVDQATVSFIATLLANGPNARQEYARRPPEVEALDYTEWRQMFLFMRSVEARQCALYHAPEIVELADRVTPAYAGKMRESINKQP